jgi:hypothetical protein
MWVQVGKEAGQSTASAIFFFRQEDRIMWVQVGKEAGQSTASAIFFFRQEDRIMWVQVGKEDGQSTASAIFILRQGREGLLTSLQPQDNFLLRQEDMLFGLVRKERWGLFPA